MLVRIRLGVPLNVLEMIISKKEYEEFEESYTFTLLSAPSYRYGQAFINYFGFEVREHLKKYSNLGTPPGVYHPNDDVILYEIKSASEAKSFIEDRFTIA